MPLFLTPPAPPFLTFTSSNLSQLSVQYSVLWLAPPPLLPISFTTVNCSLTNNESFFPYNQLQSPKNRLYWGYHGFLCSTVLYCTLWTVSLSFLWFFDLTHYHRRDLFSRIFPWSQYNGPTDFHLWGKKIGLNRLLPILYCRKMVSSDVSTVHRRRIYSEEKAKVVATVWEQNLFNSLPHYRYSIAPGLFEKMDE